MSTEPNHAIKTTSTTAGGIPGTRDRELSSPQVDQSTRCPIRELAFRKLAYPRVVQLPSHALKICSQHKATKCLIINSSAFGVGLRWAIKKSMTGALCVISKCSWVAMDARVERAQVMHVDSLSVIIANLWSWCRPNKCANGLLVYCVCIKVQLDNFFDKAHMTAKFCWSWTSISKTLSVQCSLSSCDRFGDYAAGR